MYIGSDIFVLKFCNMKAAKFFFFFKQGRGIAFKNRIRYRICMPVTSGV